MGSCRDFRLCRIVLTSALLWGGIGFGVLPRAVAQEPPVTVAEGFPRLEEQRYQQFIHYIEQALEAYNVDHDKEQASAFFRSALIVDPESPEMYFALSQLEDSPQTVIDLALEAIRYRPFLNPALVRMDTRLLAITDARLYETLGRAYKELGDEEKARYYLEKVLEDNTNDRRVGLSYMSLGEMTKADDPHQAMDLLAKSRKALVGTDDKTNAALAGYHLWRERGKWAWRFIKQWNSLPGPEEARGMLLLRLVGFFLFSLLLYTIADKEAYSRLWMSWLPIAQWFVICDLVDLPRHLTVFTFAVVFPVVGVPIFLIVKAFFVLILLTTLQAPRWLALFMLSGIPFLDLVPLVVLAFKPRPPKHGF